MQKVTDNIYIVPGRNRGRFPFCHCIYIKDEVTALIDSAAGDEALLPLQGKVDVLINSHFHPDHIRGNYLFPDARVLCHPDDLPPLVSKSDFLLYTGFRRFDEKNLGAILASIDYRESRVDDTFTDGAVLDFGRTRLRVIHTPGHSPGHCCFLDENTGILIGADVDLTPFGPWYAHDYSNLEDFQRSLHKLMAVGADRFISSHEDAYITENVGRRLALYEGVFSARDAVILEALETPLTLDELAGKSLIYPRFPEPLHLFHFFEQNMLEKHLERLLQKGLVAREGGLYRPDKPAD